MQLLGKTYLADDLTVQSGNNSNVTIRGEYYGFGNPDASKPDSVADMKNYNWIDNDTTEALYNEYGRKDSALNSSIIINGKNTTMDLSGVQRLMLAGRNYIKGSTEIATGESLSVKGSQLAYLLPAELLGNGEQTNPMTYAQYKKITENRTKSIGIQMDKPVAEWGNKTLSQIGVDEKNPVQENYYPDNTAGDTGYVYFYLNFTDSSKASAFMQYYYSKSNVNPETATGSDGTSKKTMKDKMDEYFSFYFGQNAGVTVNDPQTYTRYITNGNVLSYNGTKKAGTLNNATNTQTGEQLKEEELKAK